MAEEEMSSSVVSSSDYSENVVSGNYDRWRNCNNYDENEVSNMIKREHMNHEVIERDRRDRDRGVDRDSERVRQRDRGRERSRERRPSMDRHSHSRRRSRERKRSRSGDRRSRSRDVKHEKRESSLEYKKMYRYWDVAPTGYEQMSPVEFKAMQAAGHVLPTLYTTEGSVVNFCSESMLEPHPSLGSAVSRQARRIYVGNIPLGVAEQSMMDFFNEQVKLNGYTQADGDPIIAVQINADKNFAFLEFRSVEETSQGLNLDGVMYNGFPLKLRRPRDYIALPTDTMIQSVIPGVVQDTPHKLFIGGLPHYLNEEQVKELLLTFGQLSGFNLVKDASTGLSKGYAFCEYADHSVTDKACMGLTGMQLGEKRIVVQRASLGAKNPASTAALMLTRTQTLGCLDPSMGGGQETEILCLHNMITAEDLVDDDEYEEIIEDIKEECGKYGQVVSVQIPRPTGTDKDLRGMAGIGKVYVEFSSRSETIKAMRALAGRTFSGRVVVTSFYDPDKYKNGFF